MLSALGQTRGLIIKAYPPSQVMHSQKNNPFAGATFLAGMPGLEPGTADPESAVLPLHYIPALLIFAQVSRRDTIRLNITFFSKKSTGSI